MKRLVLAVMMLAFCSLCWGETPNAAGVTNPKGAAAPPAQQYTPRTASDSPDGPADCAFTFTSGAANSFLKYCVTANGNVTKFETPEGNEHIAIGQIGEGYGICDKSTEVAYLDYAEDGVSSNWGPPAVVSQSAKSVKIARTTSDGLWTLTQTFTQVPGLAPSANITMTLKNNSNVPKDTYLVRYVDVDAGGATDNNLDATQNSAFGWNSVGANSRNAPVGLVLQNIGTTHADYLGLALNTFDGPNPCNPAAGFVPGTLLSTDGSLVMLYGREIGARSTATVTVAYKGL